MKKLLRFRNLLMVLFVIIMFSEGNVRDNLLKWCTLIWLVANCCVYLSPKLKPFIYKAKDRIMENKILFDSCADKKIAFEPKTDFELEEEFNDDEIMENNEGFKDNQDFLLRNVNFRITEMLKKFYENATWGWLTDITSLDGKLKCARIKTSDTGEFTEADVVFYPSGEIKFSMIKPLELEKNDVSIENQLSKDDVQTWYETVAFNVINETINEINSQGHRFLEIAQDGTILVREQNQSVEYKKIDNMLDKSLWEELAKCLTKDDIKLKILNDKLVLSWGGKA